MKPDEVEIGSKEVSGAGAGPGSAPGREATEARVRTLVARARDRDADAFRELVVLHQDRAYALALRITRSPADAEEVAQDGFVRAWLALPRFRGESSFGTWLHSIVARRALDRLSAIRTRGAREVGVEEAENLSATSPHAAHAAAHAGGIDSALRARRVERLVYELPAAQRAAVTLYYYEGKSVAQVAEMLQMPENTVKTHLSRARSALRTALLREDA